MKTQWEGADDSFRGRVRSWLVGFRMQRPRVSIRTMRRWGISWWKIIQCQLGHHGRAMPIGQIVGYCVRCGAWMDKG